MPKKKKKTRYQKTVEANRKEKKRQAYAAAEFERKRTAGTLTAEEKRAYKMCTSKRRYASNIDALMFAARSRSGDMLRAYECPVCGGWHLTHTPLAEEEEEEKE